MEQSETTREKFSVCSLKKTVIWLERWLLLWWILLMCVCDKIQSVRHTKSKNPIKLQWTCKMQFDNRWCHWNFVFLYRIFFCCYMKRYKAHNWTSTFFNSIHWIETRTQLTYIGYPLKWVNYECICAPLRTRKLKPPTPS